MTTEDTELAAAIENLRRGTEIRLAALQEGRVSVGTGRRLVTIVRAMLARPDGAPQHLVQGDRVETADGVRATVTGPAPRGPHGEPAVNLDWDGDAGGPAYEHDLRRVVDARPAVARTDGQPPADERAALVPSIERALFGTTDGDLLDNDSDVPVGELRRLLREVWAAAPADDTAAPGPIAGYVLARVDDGTVTLWDDDVRTSRREVQIAHVEHVDDPGAGWRCYELRDVCEPVRDSQGRES